MLDEWQDQLREFVNTVDKLKQYINLTAEEEEVLRTNETTWGTTPYLASMMDPDDPSSPIRRQVLPSVQEQQNRFGWMIIWSGRRIAPPRNSVQTISPGSTVIV